MTLRRRAPARPTDEAGEPNGPPERLPEPSPPQAPGRAVARAASREADAVTRAAGVVVAAGAQSSAPFAGPMPEPGEGYARIVERVFSLPDPDAEYEALERALVLGTREFDSIHDALDHAEDNARRAHRLFVAAKLDYERFVADADVIEGAMRTEATADLQAEKESGARTKQITDADVRAKCAALFPDEFRDLAERRTSAKLAVEHLERFADLWVSRCRSLGGMLAARR